MYQNQLKLAREKLRDLIVSGITANIEIILHALKKTSIFNNKECCVTKLREFKPLISTDPL
jgi:hypothetical protein